MKIRILNAGRMGVSGRYSDGDVVEVYSGCGDLTESGVEDGFPYCFDWEWQNKYFEIVEEEESAMKEPVNNVKIRVNNPDHSKAIQEWLFERGAEWRTTKSFNNLESKFLFVGTFNAGELTYSDSYQHFQDSSHEELDLKHLDPHLQKPLKETVKVHKKADPQYTQEAMLQKHLKQLSELEHAIELHDNKQNKRRQERQKLLEIINESMPKRVKVVVGEYQ